MSSVKLPLGSGLSLDDGDDLKATLQLFPNLDYCSLGDIADILRDFNENLASRLPSISLKHDIEK